jgi:hypothetical protein
MVNNMCFGMRNRSGSKGRLVLAIILTVAAAACGGNPIGPGDSGNGDSPTGGGGTGGLGGGERQNIRLQAIGCFLQGTSGSAATLATLASTRQIFWRSGNFSIDAFPQQEGLNLVSTFALSPRLFFLNDDHGANAYATPEVANALGLDGTVLFGRRMILEQFQRDPSGASVIAVMAHEFGHLAQFRGGLRETGKRPELHADFMAGWYMSLRGRHAWANLQPALQVFYNLDYEFNSPAHHGTPQERLAAAQAGFVSGASNSFHAYSMGLRYLGVF